MQDHTDSATRVHRAAQAIAAQTVAQREEVRTWAEDDGTHRAEFNIHEQGNTYRVTMQHTTGARFITVQLFRVEGLSGGRFQPMRKITERPDGWLTALTWEAILTDLADS